MMICSLSLAATDAAVGQVWNCVLPDTVVVADSVVRLIDLAAGPVPADVADLVVQTGGRPGTSQALSRRTVLRKLVGAGLAGGVRFRGSDVCQVVFEGKELSPDALSEDIRRILQPLVPVSRPGAPNSWLELDFPAGTIGVQGECRLSLRRTQLLEPGRNTVQIDVTDGTNQRNFPVTVTLHAFGEVGKTRQGVERSAPLDMAQFQWQWRDLAEPLGGLVINRESLLGASAARSLSAGDLLRESDLKPTAVVAAGDPLEMRVIRGGVAVSVRAFARQDGCMGQTIPVRNELTGQLVNARVAGPGLVEWRN